MVYILSHVGNMWQDILRSNAWMVSAAHVWAHSEDTGLMRWLKTVVWHGHRDDRRRGDSCRGGEGHEYTACKSSQAKAASPSTHERVVLRYVRIQAHTNIRVGGLEKNGTKRWEEEGESREKRGDGGGGWRKEKWGREEKKKKRLSSFRPSRPPVAFQPVSSTGLGKWSTAASLTYIVCIMLLLELSGRGEGWWTLICIELLSPLLSSPLPAERFSFSSA